MDETKLASVLFFMCIFLGSFSIAGYAAAQYYQQLSISGVVALNRFGIYEDAEGITEISDLGMDTTEAGSNSTHKTVYIFNTGTVEITLAFNHSVIEPVEAEGIRIFTDYAAGHVIGISGSIPLDVWVYVPPDYSDYYYELSLGFVSSRAA